VLQLGAMLLLSLLYNATLSVKSAIVSVFSGFFILFIISLFAVLLHLFLKLNLIRPKAISFEKNPSASNRKIRLYQRIWYLVFEFSLLKKLPAPVYAAMKAQFLSGSRKDGFLILILIFLPFIGIYTFFISDNKNIAVIYMMVGTISTSVLLIAFLQGVFELKFWQTILPFSNRHIFYSRLTIQSLLLFPWIIIGTVFTICYGQITDYKYWHCLGAIGIILILSVRIGNYYRTKPEFATFWTLSIFFILATSFHLKLIWPAMIIIPFILFYKLTPKYEKEIIVP
jgi:hypothetical protein